MDYTARAAEVRPAESLSQLASVANRAVQSGTESLRVAGDALLKARALCKHGEWIPWLDQNITFSRQYAARLMRAARRPTAHGVLDAIATPAADEPEPNGNLVSICPDANSDATPDELPTPPLPPLREPSPPVQPRTPWTRPALPSTAERERDREEVERVRREVSEKIDTAWITPEAGRRLAGEELIAFTRSLVERSQELMAGAQKLRVYLDESPVAVQASFVCLELHQKLEAALSQTLLEPTRG